MYKIFLKCQEEKIVRHHFPASTLSIDPSQSSSVQSLRISFGNLDGFTIYINNAAINHKKACLP